MSAPKSTTMRSPSGFFALSRVILLFVLAAAPCLAGTIFFQGTFSEDDQVALFSFTANAPEVLTFQTYSYAGGTVNSTVVQPGGFEPTIERWNHNCGLASGNWFIAQLAIVPLGQP
jgi:hypothetical protein